MSTTGAPNQPSSSKATSLAEALSRLNRALDGLENAADSSIEARDKSINADEQVQRMASDRAKLARELDEAEAKAVALRDTNSEVSRKLVGAMEMVRGVIEKQS